MVGHKLDIAELDKNKIISIINGADNVKDIGRYCTESARESIDLYTESEGVRLAYHYQGIMQLYKNVMDRE